MPACIGDQPDPLEPVVTSGERSPCLAQALSAAKGLLVATGRPSWRHHEGAGATDRPGVPGQDLGSKAPWMRKSEYPM